MNKEYSFNGKELFTGDNVISVCGKFLRESVIETIADIKEGYTFPRIKLKGQRDYVYGHQLIKL